MQNKNSKLNLKLKSKKKGGFTLIEVVAVIAIICILIVALLPKFSGYITQAKKVEVVKQCRNVVMAVEAYDMKAETPIEESLSIKSIEDDIREYLGDETLDKLDTNMTLTTCRNIVDGKQEFNIDSTGKYTS